MKVKIITITLNPAFDIHCHIDHFVPFHENLAQVTMRDAGGKGVNISRALTGNQISNTALVVLGEENEADFVKCLEADRIFYHKIAVLGRIRENITIHTTGADETRISFPGFLADERLLASVEKEIHEIWEEGMYITFTGRVPEGIGMEAVKAFFDSLVMLEGKDGCRHKNCSLLTIACRLECCAYSHLGLAEAYIAADQSIHWLLGLHVALNSGDGGLLIGSILPLERCLKLLL